MTANKLKIFKFMRKLLVLYTLEYRIFTDQKKLYISIFYSDVRVFEL